jgi:hypothetical protein
VDVAVVELAVVKRELDGCTYWYKVKPLGPPQKVLELPAQTILQRLSVAVTDPAVRVFPQ